MERKDSPSMTPKSPGSLMIQLGHGLVSEAF